MNCASPILPLQGLGYTSPPVRSHSSAWEPGLVSEQALCGTPVSALGCTSCQEPGTALQKNEYVRSARVGPIRVQSKTYIFLLFNYAFYFDL